VVSRRDNKDDNMGSMEGVVQRHSFRLTGIKKLRGAPRRLSGGYHADGGRGGGAERKGDNPFQFNVKCKTMRFAWLLRAPQHSS
jgi:hypothetical protein